MSEKNRIKVLRVANGWSLEELAQRAGTTNQQISLLETGKRRLTVEWLLLLGKALKCHPWELVAHTMPDPPSAPEIQLLEGFRRLTSDQQHVVLALINVMPASYRARRRREPA